MGVERRVFCNVCTRNFSDFSKCFKYEITNNNSYIKPDSIKIIGNADWSDSEDSFHICKYCMTYINNINLERKNK